MASRLAEAQVRSYDTSARRTEGRIAKSHHRGGKPLKNNDITSSPHYAENTAAIAVNPADTTQSPASYGASRAADRGRAGPETAPEVREVTSPRPAESTPADPPFADGMLDTCTKCGESFVREHYPTPYGHTHNARRRYRRCPDCRPVRDDGPPDVLEQMARNRRRWGY